MQKYLVVLDLDDTLLQSDKSISNYSKEILKSCQNLGCKIVVSTARSYIRTIDFAKEINADYICAFNGNFVCDKDDNLLYYRSIDTQTSKEVIDELSKYSDRIVNEGLYGSFCTSQLDVDFVDSKFASINFIRNLQSCKLIIRCDDREYSYIKEIIEAKGLSITFSREKNTARILPKYSDKWNGIKKISEELNGEYKIIAFGDDITDLETLKNADIGIRMANSVEEIIENINFSTDTNNADGVAKFLCHYFNLDENKKRWQNVKVLDCSLRDGGHLNYSHFGHKTIKSFIEKLAKANIDIIEIGFLQGTNYDSDCAIFSNIKEAEELLSDIDCGQSTISLMMQVDKFDIDNLQPCSGKVKLIRVSFHSDLIDVGMHYCSEVKRKGYLCSLNPINFSHYTNEQVIELISKVNKVNPNIFSIVDTFGVLLSNDFRNKLNLINHLLNKNIERGIHLHENLGIAFSSAQTLIETNSEDGQVIIDTSVSGIGRAPGNLKTELVTYYLNKAMNKKKYSMEYIYLLLEKEIPKLQKTLDWHNHFAYSISAFEKMHRTYAEYLINKGIGLAKIQELMEQIPKENRGRFDENIIKQIYENNK